MFPHYSGEGPSLRQLFSHCAKEEERYSNSSSRAEEKLVLSESAPLSDAREPLSKSSDWFGQTHRPTQSDMQILSQEQTGRHDMNRP